MEKYGYIDKSGSLVIPPQFDTPGYYTEGVAAVEVDGKCGFIDKQGNFVIPLQFERALWFSEGLAAVCVDSKYSYINKFGKVVFPPIFRTGDEFVDGLALVRTKTTVGYINTNGEWALIPPYLCFFTFSEGLARVYLGGEEFNEGYIDITGKEVIPTHFEDTSDFSEGYAYVKTKDGEHVFIDKTGQVVLDLAFRIGSYHYFSEGLVSVKINQKYGFADKAGTLVIEPEFDTVGRFNQALAPASVDGKYGYIDKSGNWVIEPRFSEAWHFSEGLSSVII